MRKLEYRAWVDGFTPDQSGMFYGISKIIFEGGYPVTIHTENGYKFKMIEEPFILMCDIGLEDNKGKKIYEGDVVYLEYSYNSKNSNLWEVVYDYDSYILARGERTVGDMNCDDDPYKIDWDEVQVRGNIYENPELLSGEQGPAIFDTMPDIIAYIQKQGFEVVRVSYDDNLDPAIGVFKKGGLTEKYPIRFHFESMRIRKELDRLLELVI